MSVANTLEFCFDAFMQNNANLNFLRNDHKFNFDKSLSFSPFVNLNKFYE
jgi:hypothetical protein